MNTEMYKLFGPLSVCITGLAILVMLIVWRNDKSMTISQHAAAHKSSYLMMLIVQSITLPMLFLFFIKALTPVAHLPLLFEVIVGIACLGLLIAAWVPDTKGWKSKVHQLCAYGAAVLIIPSLTLLSASAHISPFAKWMAIIVLSYDVAAIVLLTVLNKAKENHLYIQAAYIFLFALTTIAAVYT